MSNYLAGSVLIKWRVLFGLSGGVRSLESHHCRWGPPTDVEPSNRGSIIPPDSVNRTRQIIRTVTVQGRSNVPHGCVNLSAASAAAYYKSTLLGDPVEVTGTKINLSPADGDLFDWAYTWPQWSTMAVKPN